MMIAGENLIDSYTRRQAIEDGVLVDLMQQETVQLVRDAGFRFPIAMTASAFGDCVGGVDGKELPTGQDLKGRLWDVLVVLRYAIKMSSGTNRVDFKVNVFDGTKTKPVELYALCGPDDDGSPAITIMLPWED